MLLVWFFYTAGGVQSLDNLKANEAYGIIDGDQHMAILTTYSATRRAVNRNDKSPPVQPEADRVIGMTPNEAYGESRINTDCDDSKTAEEQDNYDYVLNI